MPFPDSSGKAPNVFFEVFDDTGAPSPSSFVAAGPKILSPVTPPPPPPPPEPPVADFSGTPLSGVAPLTVQFTDLSTNTPTSWSWDFENDGIIDSTDQNPIWEYQLPGTYDVSLTAANPDGSNLNTKIGYITVTTPVLVNYTFILRTTPEEMDYSAAYLSEFPGATPVTGSYNTSIVPSSGTTFLDNKTVYITSSSKTVIGDITMSSSITFYWEYKIGNTGPSPIRLQVGAFVQAFGPPFNANTANGGPLSSYYVSNGSIVGYGGSSSGHASYTEGDVIGVVCDNQSARLWFFKNGVKQAYGAPLSNNILQAMSGTSSGI